MRSPAAARPPAAVAALLAVLMLACAAAPSAYASVGPRSALLDLNAMRARAGVPLVREFQRSLNGGCRLHNRYMQATGEFGHQERRASAYYTRSGARAAASSVIAEPSDLPSGAWGDTVYHRLAILQPRLRRSGFAGSYGFSCLQVLRGVSNAPAARTRQVTLYPWPAQGATGVMPGFDVSESPDPRLDAPGATDLGAPITVDVNGPWKYWQLARSHVAAASLAADDGRRVAVSVADANSANGRYTQDGFALLPRQPLSPDTGYSWSATGSVKYQGRSWPFTVAAHFTTGADIF